ncbi:MAG TPA: amidohydrolase, partial [Firmicutes bacterium]|nr:amidohydrolase [Bacillota bacterium]
MLLVKGAKIYPVNGPMLATGMLLIDDNGKIAAIGETISAPASVDVLDLTGKVILPGFVDAHSHVGIWGDGEGRPAY